MRRAPAIRAPWIAFRPTPPAPITTTSSPGRSWPAFTTAPMPVMTPQDNRLAEAMGRLSGIAATWL